MEPLAKLFGTSARLKLLRLFFFNKDTAFSVEEAATRTKLSSEAVRKELADMVSAGIFKKRGERAAARYQVNGRFEHFSPLDHFIRETTSVHPTRVLSELKKSGTLRLVVLTGMFTGTQEPAVDLLVVGDALTERTLASAVHALEAELGREIRYASFATPDFRYRLGVYDRLIRDVFDYPHRLLVDRIGL